MEVVGVEGGRAGRDIVSLKTGEQIGGNNLVIDVEEERGKIDSTNLTSLEIEI